MTIEWKTVKGVEVANLLHVTEVVPGHPSLGGVREATRDDLRTACESAGWVCTDKSVYTAIIEKAEEHRTVRESLEADLKEANRMLRDEQADRLSYQVELTNLKASLADPEYLTSLCVAAGVVANLVVVTGPEVQRALEDNKKICEAANAAGWDGVQNPKTVWEFITALKSDLDNAETRWSATFGHANRWSVRAHEAEALLDQALQLGREAVATLEADPLAARGEHDARVKRVNEMYALGTKKGALIGEVRRLKVQLERATARIDELKSIIPHNSNVIRDASRIKRDCDVALAALGAAQNSDIVNAARTVTGLLELERAKLRALTVDGFTASKALEVGLAECERLRARIAELEAPLPEATAEELLDICRPWDLAIPQYASEALLAVAARIRRERCLIARAVAGGVGLEMWKVDTAAWRVSAGGNGPLYVPAAEVPATLARMIGEVGA